MTNTFPEAYYDRVSEVLTSDINSEFSPESLIIRNLGLLSQFLNLKNGRVLIRDSNSGELTLRYSESDEISLQDQRVGCDGVSQHDVSTTKLYVPVSSNDAGIVASIAAMNATFNKGTKEITVPIIYKSRPLGVLQVDCVNMLNEDREAIENVLSSVADMFGEIMVENSLCDMPLSA